MLHTILHDVAKNMQLRDLPSGSHNEGEVNGLPRQLLQQLFGDFKDSSCA